MSEPTVGFAGIGRMGLPMARNLLRAGFPQPDTEPVAFTTDLMRKDASLAEDLAGRLGVRLPAVAAAVGVLDEALRDGLGDADIASVISVLGDRRQRSRRSASSTT